MQWDASVGLSIAKCSVHIQQKSGIDTNQISGIDYWTEENQGAYYPRPGSGDDQTIGNAAIKVYDGSFIKIKNITLGYTLPKSISKHALMEKCRFYFTAYNPWIFCYGQ